MIRRPPRSTRTDTLLPLHDALPISFIPTQSGDALVTLSSGVYRLDLESPGLEPRLTLLCMADPTPGNRANEARCDAQGQLWLGTMQNNIGEEGEDLPIERRSGGLVRLDTDGRVLPLLRKRGLPNTLLWSQIGRASCRERVW